MTDVSIYLVAPIYKGPPLIQMWLLQLIEEIMKALFLHQSHVRFPSLWI